MIDAAADRELIVASEADHQQLEALDRMLEAVAPEQRLVIGPDGQPLPTPVLEVLRRAVKALAKDEAVSITPIPQLLTMADAADSLNMAEAFLGQLLNRGDLPFVMVDQERRIRYRDLVAYKNARDARRRAALRDLTRMNQEFGLYERHERSWWSCL